MIDAKELRIGNWINIGVMTIPVSVFTIDYDRRDGYLVNKVQESDLHPIPLSPEVLKACGFENQQGWNDKWVFNKCVGVNFHQGKIYYNDLQKTVELTSLHQLQNLFYALTQTELIYQPSKSLQ